MENELRLLRVKVAQLETIIYHLQVEVRGKFEVLNQFFDHRAERVSHRNLELDLEEDICLNVSSCMAAHHNNGFMQTLHAPDTDTTVPPPASLEEEEHARVRKRKRPSRSRQPAALDGRSGAQHGRSRSRSLEGNGDEQVPETQFLYQTEEPDNGQFETNGSIIVSDCDYNEYVGFTIKSEHDDNEDGLDDWCIGSLVDERFETDPLALADENTPAIFESSPPSSAKNSPELSEPTKTKRTFDTQVTSGRSYAVIVRLFFPEIVFDDGDKIIAKCNLCPENSKPVSGQHKWASNFNRHLRIFHPEAYRSQYQKRKKELEMEAR